MGINQSLQYELNAFMAQVVASGLMQSLVTFQERVSTLGPTGAPDQSYTNISGLVDILCTVPPNSATNIRANEKKTPREILSNAQHIVVLHAYYPQVEAGWRDGWRCIVSDVDQITGDKTNPFTYDILGVDANATGQTTRILVQFATV